MSRSKRYSRTLDRRDFFRASGGSLLAVAGADLLAGCGGGSDAAGGDGQPGGGAVGQNLAPTRSTSGTINRKEIGGTGLKLQSIYQPGLAVAETGAFSIRTSAVGAQLLFVTDSAGKPRALALAYGSSVKSLDIGATSTAVALLMLSPGLLSTDPAVALQRSQDLQALAPFTPFKNFLATHLPTAGLIDLQSDPMFGKLTVDCINAWLATKTKEARTRDLDPLFGASLTPPDGKSVTLTNKGWRFLTVVRQDLDCERNPIATRPLKKLALLDGSTPFGWSTLLKTGTPGKDTDAGPISGIADVAYIKYWVHGPGLFSGPQAPADVEAMFDINTAWGASLIYYLVYPLIDLMIGVLGKVSGIKDPWSAFNVGVTGAKLVWDKFKFSKNLGKVITAARDGDLSGFAAAMAAFTKEVLAVLILVLEAMEAPAAIIALFEAFSDVIAILSLVWVYANAIIAAVLWFATPNEGSEEVAVTKIASIQASASIPKITVKGPPAIVTARAFDAGGGVVSTASFSFKPKTAADATRFRVTQTGPTTATVTALAPGAATLEVREVKSNQCFELLLMIEGELYFTVEPMYSGALTNPHEFLPILFGSPYNGQITGIGQISAAFDLPNHNLLEISIRLSSPDLKSGTYHYSTPDTVGDTDGPFSMHTIITESTPGVANGTFVQYQDGFTDKVGDHGSWAVVNLTLTIEASLSYASGTYSGSVFQYLTNIDSPVLKQVKGMFRVRIATA